jgi:tyrosyl-tRNA synthetase
MSAMPVLDELRDRGLLQDVTEPETLGPLLDAGQIRFYAGYDPTAVSLHIGNLVPLSVMRHLALRGNQMIALVGGATGVVGDPSGRSSERALLDDETLARNHAGVLAQVRRLVAVDATFVNNADWFRGVEYLTFLRTVGKHITVNYMLAKESVRARLEDREQGISYTEFSYMLLQAYDFVVLARTHGCRLQVGGSDQWGNITCGIELYRKMQAGAGQLFGLTAPLLMTAAGTKFGKSEKGQNVWLDPQLTSPYQLFQWWLNTDDKDVEKYLKMFTLVRLDEIAALMAEHDAEPSRRAAQRRLAAEVTTWVHGAETARRVIAASQVLFGGSVADLSDADLEPILADAPATDVAANDLDAGIALVELLVRSGLCDSKAEARRLLSQGGVYLNNLRIDADRAITRTDLATETMMLLRAGKKKYAIVRAR